MKFKQIKFPILAAALSLVLTGCFPTGRLESSSQESPISDDNSSETSAVNSAVNSEPPKNNPNEKLYKELKLDEIEVPTELPKIKLKGWIDYTPEQLENLSICKGKKLETEYDPQKRHVTITADDLELSFYENTIHYGSGDKADIFERATYSTADIFHTYSDEEYDDFPIADAKKMAEEIIDELDLKNFKAVRYVSIPSGAINKELDEYDIKHSDEPIGKRLTEDEKMYYIQYAETFNDIPTPHDATGGIIPLMGDASADRTEFGAPASPYIKAVVTKTGVKHLGALVISNEYELGETVPVKYSAKDALNFVLENYEDPMRETGKLVDCKLVYAIEAFENLEDRNQTIVYTPVWEFTREYDEHNVGKRVSCNFVMVDDDTVFSSY